jgi:3-oxoacyl-[acyl-carrier protein] reductase
MLVWTNPERRLATDSSGGVARLRLTTAEIAWGADGVCRFEALAPCRGWPSRRIARVPLSMASAIECLVVKGVNVATNQGRLVGQVALVTGASKGIGRASALALAREGASVVAVALADPVGQPDLLRELGQEISATGVGYAHVAGDVREPETATAAVALAMEKFGRIDLLLNNAGIGLYAAFTECDLKTYDEIMDTIMRSTYLFSAGVVPIMKTQGRGLILQIASVSGLRGFGSEAIYCAAKHAQVGFTRALRQELQPFGIKVGAICPAGVNTHFALGRGRTPQSYAASGFLEAEDVADAVLFAACQPPRARMGEISLISINEPLQF